MTLSLDRPLTVRSEAPALPRRHWRIAGWLALAHLVLLYAGVALQNGARMEEGVAGIERAYVDGSASQTMTGGYVGLLGFLLLIPVLVFLARAIGWRTAAGGWAAQTALLAGVAYLAITFSPGMAAGATALHAVQNGADLETALVMNDLRVMSYVVSLLLLGTHALALGIAAINDRVFTRWIGWGGVVAGVALFVAVPLTALELQDLGSLVWFVWWVGVAVCLVRHRPAHV